MPSNQQPSEQPESYREEAQRIINRYDRMDNEAINWKTHWQECYENIVPRKEDVIATRLPGDRRDMDIYDTTAVRACEMLASALHGMLTNPETRFFDILFNEPLLMMDPQVKNWCEDAADYIYRLLNNTNFQTEIYEIYIDLGAIGTGCLFIADDDESVAHFSARAMKEIRIDENAQGLIDVVYRLFKLRPQQIIEMFGQKNCPHDIITAADKGSQDEVEIIHCVEPVDPVRNLLSYVHPFKSTYVLRNPRFILEKGGYHEFPYAVPRWSKTTGEKYGRGPGMAMLPDIMMLNAMMLTVIQGAQKTVDPPLMVTDDGVIGVVRLTPGGLTVVRPGNENMIKPLITDARIDFGEKMLENVRDRIRDGFFINQMMLREGPQKTAQEVVQLTEERLRLMGPVLGRQHFELLMPMLTRILGIAERKRKIPPRPAKIADKKVSVRFSSMIAQVQRLNEANNIARAFALAGPMIQVKPQLADLFDEDKIAKRLWDIYGCDHRLLRSTRDLDKMRQQRTQMQQQLQKQQQEQHQAQISKLQAPMVGALAQAQQGQNGGQ